MTMGARDMIACSVARSVRPVRSSEHARSRPISAEIAKPLVGSLQHEVICKEHDIAQYVPDPEGGLVGYDEAVRRALAEAAGGVTTTPSVRPAAHV